MNAPGTRRIGLAPLSMLDVAPPDLVDIAADAGFDFVGIRVRAVTTAETPYDLSVGSDLLQATVARLQARQIPCLDAEFILLNGRTGPDDWRPALASASALGAATMTIAINDPEPNRADDSLAALLADVAEAGLRGTIEPISYNTVRSVPAAAELARRHGCQVLLDSLHLTRFGAEAEQLAAAADLVPMVQLCDGPAVAPPDRDGLVAESRSERMSPGEGDFPLAMYLAQVGADVPVSVEVPSVRLRAGQPGATPQAYAEHLLAATRALLQAAETPTQQEGA